MISSLSRTGHCSCCRGLSTLITTSDVSLYVLRPDVVSNFGTSTYWAGTRMLHSSHTLSLPFPPFPSQLPPLSNPLFNPLGSATLQSNSQHISINSVKDGIEGRPAIRYVLLSIEDCGYQLLSTHTCSVSIVKRFIVGFPPSLLYSKMYDSLTQDM